MSDNLHSSIETKICSLCHDLDLSGLVMSTFRADSPVLKAKAGCRGCRIILFAVEPYIGLGFFEITQYYFGTISCWFSRAGDATKQEVILIHKLPAETPTVRSWPHTVSYADHISTNTGSQQSIETARSWLETCVTKHTCSDLTATKLPTRVLRIDGPDRIRLYISQGEMEFYACLSHCWGNQPGSILTTTSSNMREFENGISLDSLPKTFRDAIYFTYHLGIRYLWIDSLCILQDSKEDWRHEGSLMANIYENGLVTLAATHAPNSKIGCFSTADSKYKPRYMDLTELGVADVSGKIYARALSPHSGFPQLDEESNFPLFSRAWAYQERRLSPRIIHFTKHELGWECRAENLCECPSYKNPECLLVETIDKVSLNDLKTPREYHDKWQNIVEEYSGKSLTYPNDIFPALQGLANKFTPVLGKYCAGLWGTTLVHDLTWHRKVYSDPQEPRPQGWRAPTWSWASISEEVRFWNYKPHESKEFATVVNVVTVPTGEDASGELSSATLVLRGRGVIATLDTQIFFPPGSTDLCISMESNSSFRASSREIFLDYDVTCRGPHFVANGSKVLLMKVIAIPGEEYRGGFQHSWLILREADRDGQFYERIGIIGGSSSDLFIMDFDHQYEELAKEMVVTII